VRKFVRGNNQLGAYLNRLIYIGADRGIEEKVRIASGMRLKIE